MTEEKKYYIIELDTLKEEDFFEYPDSEGLKSYSIIIVDENGAFEVDRAYRSVSEALESWPEAIPPRD